MDGVTDCVVVSGAASGFFFFFFFLPHVGIDVVLCCTASSVLRTRCPAHCTRFGVYALHCPLVETVEALLASGGGVVSWLSLSFHDLGTVHVGDGQSLPLACSPTLLAQACGCVLV